MTGVTFSRLAALVQNALDSYNPPEAYFSILIGALASVGMGLAINLGYTNFNIFSFEAGDFDFPAVLGALGFSVISLIVLYVLA